MDIWCYYQLLCLNYLFSIKKTWLIYYLLMQTHCSNDSDMKIMLLQKANEGDTESMFRLGLMYEDGRDF